VALKRWLAMKTIRMQGNGRFQRDRVILFDC
jgi:hypothetical protein